MNFQDLNYVVFCENDNKPYGSTDDLLREYLTALVISVSQTLDSKL